MPSEAFLFVDDEPISKAQVLNYLQASGQLENFIEEVLSQHAIAKELEENPDFWPGPDALDTAIQDFRQEQNLEDDKVFLAWLDQNNLEAESLGSTLLQQKTMQQLIHSISQPKLQEYFLNRKEQLDQIYLSCIVVQNEATARSLHIQIHQEEASFEDLAKAHSLADNRLIGGTMLPMTRADLGSELLIEINAAQPGSLIGPWQVDEQWYLFRLDKILRAEWEEDTKKQLQIELFQQWLTDRINAMTVKMEVAEWLYL
ncbi:MAG: peptidylprolyl isomerase [Leptolyngbyaceae cyanobacterium SM2_5_2]|nr:peptidylprolyl isomerase [Leptolyngbyaceae cyanobacterium SM2_5_2]